MLRLGRRGGLAQHDSRKRSGDDRGPSRPEGRSGWQWERVGKARAGCPRASRQDAGATFPGRMAGLRTSAA